MNEQEKIIKGLCELSFRATWADIDGIRHKFQPIINEAIAMLKERDPIKPYMDYDGQDVWRCGGCGNSLMHPSYYESDEDAKNYIRYCSHCGKAVNWE